MPLFFACWLLLAAPFAEAETLSLRGLPALHHPIVLVHGATEKGSRLQIGPFNFGDYFRGIKEFYEATHTPVYVAELSTDGSIGQRGAVLKNFLDTDLRGQKVNIIAHSLAGLDSRYAITVLRAEQVASLTTISSPHRGTPLADWAVEQIARNGFWYRLFRFFGYDMAQRRFLPELSTKGMKLFNEKVPDLPGVRYYSVRAQAPFTYGKMSLMLWFPAHWIELQNGGPVEHGQDGMVPFDSQGWGQVIFDAELDHLAEINHQEWRGESEDAASLAMYAKVYQNLLGAGL